MLLNKSMFSLRTFFKSPVIIGALFILFSANNVNAHHWTTGNSNYKFYSIDKIYSNNTIHSILFITHHSSDFPNPLRKIFTKAQRNNKIAAALAFPLPFGCVGLHRVYLGTAPHVPLVYAVSAGGVFGLIPLIDCITLLSHKNTDPYENNGNIIMWIHHTNTRDSTITHSP
jgi:TM2 domain-containing membrane protein YozV